MDHGEAEKGSEETTARPRRLTTSAVEAVGFDLELIWCRVCGAVSGGAVGVGLSFGCQRSRG
uniref:Uncharacterized protein n=1 Tax=Fagus sylvatica TaxID=28930 RepID=A0A2N9GYJ6_FAGSY